MSKAELAVAFVSIVPLKYFTKFLGHVNIEVNEPLLPLVVLIGDILVLAGRPRESKKRLFLFVYYYLPKIASSVLLNC